MAKIELLLRQVIQSWKQEATVLKIEPITPDASFRRYYRIYLGEAPETVVAMVFDSVQCPEVGGGLEFRSDEAYVALTKYLQTHGVSVPELLFDARHSSVILIEDLGDIQLFSVLKGGDQEKIDTGYRRAIDQIIAIQKIPKEKSFFAFGRFLDASVYIREMEEFLDFVFSPISSVESEAITLRNLFCHLGEELEAQEQVLVHRDFHAWNLLLDSQGALRVIDFQDALLGTRAYDLVALLNDRDMDTLLGEKRYREFLHYFVQQAGLGDDFYKEYDRVLLQRDLKVAGRFSKLSNMHGLIAYEQWIPGTLRRIGQTLERLQSSHAVYKQTLELLSTKMQEVEEGGAMPFRLR